MLDLRAAKGLRVLVMGDDIVDEYKHVNVIGKAVKENALSSIARTTERFRGGVVAAAAHTKAFCDRVQVSHREWAMLNSRIVDSVYLRKLFVVHERIPGTPTPQVNIADYDLVIVFDFGHGFMDQRLIEKVCKEAKYLAVNAQTNATNYGFNLITKYPRADLVVVDALEARLATQVQDCSISMNMRMLKFDRVIVTMGVEGALGYKDEKFYEAPAVADRVRDTMGCGDAFLAVCAPFAAVGFEMDDLLRIGNAAAAVKADIVGHRRSVKLEEVEALL